MKNFPFYKQPDVKDCGPSCLRIICKHYGKQVSLQYIRKLSETTRESSSLSVLSAAAESLGFSTLGMKINFELLKDETPFPCIVHWKRVYYVVVYEINNKDNIVYVSDPAYGLISYSKDDFVRSWIGDEADETTEAGIIFKLHSSFLIF